MQTDSVNGQELEVVCGSADGISMRVHVVGGSLDVRDKNSGLVHGIVPSWTQVAVITTARRASAGKGEVNTNRFWLLEPGAQLEHLTLGPLRVSGRFVIAEKKNGSAAHEAWKAFKSSHATANVAGDMAIPEKP